MKKILITLAALAISVSSYAQDTFSVATGDSKGGSTYSQMFRELSVRCGTTANLSERETTGSVQNMELLTGNQVNAAIVQTDLLFFTKMTDESKVANIRTLAALHPEELHFIARGDVKREGGVGIGSFKVGGKDVVFNTVADLKTRTIGAVGGSVLSGRVFSAQSGLAFTVQEFKNNDDLKAALLAGTVDSILVVGGAPHGLVKGLDQRFRMLAVDPATATKVSSVYAPTKLSYGNLNQSGVPSVSTQALLVTRLYRSPATLQQLANMRACFDRELPHIQDQAKTHPKWQLVDTANKGKWPVYELPPAK